MNASNNSAVGSSKLLHLQQPQQHKTQVNNQQQMLDYMQRARMPPPGFNHMNTYGFGAPRIQNNSKILPFMNLNTNATGNTNGQPMQQQLPISNSTWNTHLGGFQQQNQQLSDSQIRQMNTNQMQNTGAQKGKKTKKFFMYI